MERDIDEQHDGGSPTAPTTHAGPRVLDGAYGTLLAAHARTGEPVELLSVTDPACVVRAHGAYLAAGATSLQTNTFLAFTLGDRRRREVLLAGLEVAREAIAAMAASPSPGRDSAGDAPGIELLATLGPGGDPRDLRRDLDLLLDRGEARGVLCETVTSRAFAIDLLAAWEEVAGTLTDARLTLSCSIDPGDGPASHAWLCALDLPVGVEFGLNCCAGPGGLERVLADVAVAHGRPVHLAPSAGVPADGGAGDPPCWPWVHPEAWAAATCELLDALAAPGPGARRVGGCCGTTPAHVAALVDEFAAR